MRGKERNLLQKIWNSIQVTTEVNLWQDNVVIAFDLLRLDLSFGMTMLGISIYEIDLVPFSSENRFLVISYWEPMNFVVSIMFAKWFLPTLFFFIWNGCSIGSFLSTVFFTNVIFWADLKVREIFVIGLP